MHELQVITFDAAGTLMVPHPSVGEAYAAALERRGISADADRIEGRFRESFKSGQERSSNAMLQPRVFWRGIVVDSISEYCPAQEIESVFDELWEHFGRGRNWRLLEGVQSTLESLRDHGLRLAVLSNNDSRLRTVLEDQGIAWFFEEIFVSSEIGLDKPEPAVFQHVEEVFQLPASSFLHVGDDSLRDAAAARNAGWEAILVTDQAGDGLRVGQLSEIPELLAGLPA